jgi:signal transduction histidine kinase
MTPTRDWRRTWRYLGGLVAPALLWGLLIVVLVVALRSRKYDEAALQEWIDESRPFRETLPELVRTYLQSADPDNAHPEQSLEVQFQAIHAQLQSLADPTKEYQQQLPLFPAIYRVELIFPIFSGDRLPSIIWESNIPRPQNTDRLEYPILGPNDRRALLQIEYQLHAYNRRQQDEQEATMRLRWVTGLALAATALTFWWISLVQRREGERAQQQQLSQEQINQSRQRLLEEELRRQEVEHRHEEAERELLEQRLATQSAERQALELKSQLYASIGIMAGSYAHNIKNLLVRPNDLLRRCLESDGLSADQDDMIRQVRQTLGTVTERLQQILHTVRRDPSRSELTRIDLNALIRELAVTWESLAREKWKLTLETELSPEPLWINGDVSHLQQAVENLLFNARDATFEMRNHLREQARRKVFSGQGLGTGEGSGTNQEKVAANQNQVGTNETIRQDLIAAAGWKGTVIVRTRKQGDVALLEMQDNGIGMTEEVRRRSTETHFSTKRDNAIYEGNTTGMGLGLSFVVVILEHHDARLEIESEPLRGALFRVRFPLISEGGDRKAEVGDQNSQDRNLTSEVGNQRSEIPDL